MLEYNPGDFDDLKDLSYTHCLSCNSKLSNYETLCISLDQSVVLCQKCFDKKRLDMGLKLLDGFDL